MKFFSKSTIMGLAFGVLLAGYAVFAYTPPTATPPGGNAPVPLNASSQDQTKTGGTLNVFGLWVNQALGVSGGATLGGILNLQGNRIINVGSPSVAGDVATKGFVDSQTSNLQTRISGSCPTGQGIRAIGSNGSVTCETIPTISGGPTFTFGTAGGTSSGFLMPAAKNVMCTVHIATRISTTIGANNCSGGTAKMICNGSERWSMNYGGLGWEGVMQASAGAFPTSANCNIQSSINCQGTIWGNAGGGCVVSQ